MAAQDVATVTFDASELKPIGSTFTAWKHPIRLDASTVYARGQVLALKPSSTTNTYVKVVQGASDGTQIGECILPYACATDASGNITQGAAATGGEWGQTETTVKAYFGGTFLTADLVTAGGSGLNAAIAATMGGRLVQAAKVLIF